MNRNTFSFLIVLLVVLASCSASHNTSSSQPTGRLKFLSEYVLPYKMQFNGTTVGGLSAIDYESKKNVYYIISDDRSDINPARFYTATISFTQKGIDSIRIIGVTTLKQKNGKPYPNKKQDPQNVPDPEGMRYDVRNGNLIWTSEGERIVKQNQSVLINPSVNIINLNGQLIDTLPLPANMHSRATENGPRQNGTFEGLTFTNDYKTLYVSVEEPIYEDGPRAALDTAGWIRIIKYDMDTKQPVAEYAYQIDPVVHPPIPAWEFKINGVPDILAINDHQLLVTERSFSTGRDGCNIKLYLAELQDAEDISSVQSLKQTPAKHPIKKTLLLNMDNLKMYIDNIEGATFGPNLPNGHRSIIFVADDNFSSTQKTQFILFEVE